VLEARKSLLYPQGAVLRKLVHPTQGEFRPPKRAVATIRAALPTFYSGNVPRSHLVTFGVCHRAKYARGDCDRR